jgi:hypothetical protein
VREQRSGLPERHSAPRCSEAVRYAAAGAAYPRPASYPRARLRRAAPKAQFESAELLPAGWATPEAIVWRPLGADSTAQFGSAELLPAGWATPEAIVWRPLGVRPTAQFGSAALLPAG